MAKGHLDFAHKLVHHKAPKTLHHHLTQKILLTPKSNFINPS